MTIKQELSKFFSKKSDVCLANAAYVYYLYTIHIEINGDKCVESQDLIEKRLLKRDLEAAISFPKNSAAGRMDPKHLELYESIGVKSVKEFLTSYKDEDFNENQGIYINLYKQTMLDVLDKLKLLGS